MNIVEQKRRQKAIDQHLKIAHGSTWVLMLLLMVFFPLFYGYSSGIYNFITEEKYFVFLIIMIAYLTAMLLALGSALYNGLLPIRNIKLLWTRSTVSQKAFVLYLFICCISALASDYPADVWTGSSRFEGLKTVLLYGVIFFGISLFGKPGKWHLLGVAAAASIVSIIGILQYLGFNVLDMYAPGNHFYNLSFMSTFGNINVVSGALCIFIPLLAVGFVTIREKWRWALLPAAALAMSMEVLANADSGVVGLGVCALVMIPILCNTRERIRDACLLGAVLSLVIAFSSALTVTYTQLENGAFEYHRALAFGSIAKLFLLLAGVCALLYVAMLLINRPLPLSPKKLSIILAVIILLGVVGGVVFVYQYAVDKPQLGFVYEASQIMRGNIQDKFGSARIGAWRRALVIAKENFWLGSGPDTFYREYIRLYRDVIDETGIVFDFAHNDYLQIICNTGIFSLLAYLLVLGYEAVRTFQNRKDAGVLLLGAAVLCYCVQIFFSFSVTIISPMFFVVLGALAGRNRSMEPRLKA